MVHIEVPPDMLHGPVLTLYNDKGSELIRDGQYGERVAWINYLLPHDGTYYLELYNDSIPGEWRQGTLYHDADPQPQPLRQCGGRRPGRQRQHQGRRYRHPPPGTGKWVLVFDASDVGITQNINAFEWTSADRLLISLQAAQNVSGLGRVTPWDIIRFTPSSLGANTAGTFSFYMKGADVGLSTTGEKIDAIAWERTYPVSGSRLLISTNGDGAVPRRAAAR
jgi:hypothetical protein